MKGLSWLIEITVMNDDIRVEEETTYLELSKKYKKMFFFSRRYVTLIKCR